MSTNPDWLTTNPAAPGRQGGVWASFLVSTLSLAVLMPGLLLQGVATRTRPGDVDLEEPDPAPAPVVPNAGDVVQATDSSAMAGSDASAADGAIADGRQGVRVNRNGKPRPERPDLTQAERIARRRERQERLAAEGDARAVRPKSAANPADGALAADPVAAPETKAPSTALAKVAPGTAVVAEGATGGEAVAEAMPPGPVTFEEVQTAFQESAAAFRDVKRSLNSAYTLIGRLNVERYQAQYELAELKGLPPPERPPDRSWQSAAKPVAPPEAKRIKKSRRDEDEELIDEEEVKRIARRRQQMVVIGLAALGIFVLAYRVVGWNWFPDITDRQAMTQIAGLGVMMQVFFLVFFLFRLGMITGRGKSWLFPTPEQEAFKRRRKRMRGH